VATNKYNSLNLRGITDLSKEVDTVDTHTHNGVANPTAPKEKDPSDGKLRTRWMAASVAAVGGTTTLAALDILRTALNGQLLALNPHLF
jgi:hypothetical protein